MRCASCGQENPQGFRFCGGCGEALEPAAPPRQVRKVVTALFCDLTGSTARGHGADPEALRATMRGYYDEMRAILERHGGTVEKFVGDAVMAVFGVPVAHEDDALRAVRAAWEMKGAVGELGLEARIGVNTGEVVAGQGDSLVTGDAVNVAARLEQAAEPGEVLIGAATRRLVRDAVRVEPVEVAAKGKPEPVDAFRLLHVDREAAPFARRLDTPLVGRTAELRQLEQAFERAVRENRCHLFTLLGAAGVGKSRLTAELLARVDARVLQGRCLDYGEGITFWPVVSVLKQLGDRARDTLERLSAASSTPNELFWAVRSQLEEVASEQPLVVCFDDIQWGEPTFLDLIDHVADLSRGAPILLLCLARPELLDKRPSWAGGKLNATTLLLEPLSGDECAQLIEAHGGVEAEVRTRILAAADGNPLFVEEMVALTRENGEVAVPETVQALLQARLDQLAGDERSVIERGAVEGQVFHRSALLELTKVPDVEPQLVGLVRKELIQPATPTFAGDHAFRFRHLLIRDAAYDALPKETRAELHERFAAWLEPHGQELLELDEVLGYHLEQAARYLRELGRPSRELEGRAGRRLAEAGSKALARSDLPAAANLLGRALAVLPEADPLRPRAAIERLAALDEASPLEERVALIEELEANSDEALRMHGRIARLHLRLMTEPQDAVAEADRVAEEALPIFLERDDDLGAAHVYFLIAWINWLQSRALPTKAAAEQLREHARRAGALGLHDRARNLLYAALHNGPFGLEHLRAELDSPAARGSPLAELNRFTVGAEIAYREGRPEDYFVLHDEAVVLTERLGLEGIRIALIKFPVDLLLALGRPAEAAEILRKADRALEEHGQTSYRSTTLVQLAQALYALGDPDEAERLAVHGEELGAAEDVVNFAVGRGLRAKIAADRGDHAEAEELARSGLEYAYRTDFPRIHASAHEALAHVHRAAGRADDARTELERALELWGRYGFSLEAARTRASLVEL